MPLNFMQNYGQCTPKACNPINVDVYTSVLSINNKTGHVTLDAVDVNAIPKPQEVVDGQYLQFKDGKWIASYITSKNNATFNAITHVVSL